MELSYFKIKKSLIFPQMEPCPFQTKLEKIKKKPPRENFFYSGKMELHNSDFKSLLIFSQEKAVLTFQEPSATDLRELF